MFLSRKSLQEESCSVVETLQWGRDVSIPEMQSPRPMQPPGLPLQWGRDVSIPEIGHVNAVADGSILLQWGRDVSIPEMLPLRDRKSRPRCFNGAGMFLSRKWTY